MNARLYSALRKAADQSPDGYWGMRGSMKELAEMGLVEIAHSSPPTEKGIVYSAYRITPAGREKLKEMEAKQ